MSAGAPCARRCGSAALGRVAAGPCAPGQHAVFRGGGRCGGGPAQEEMEQASAGGAGRCSSMGICWASTAAEAEEEGDKML